MASLDADRDLGTLELPRWRGVRQEAKTLTMRLLKQGGAFRFFSHRNRQAIPILCYHGIWMGDDGFAGDSMYMRPETFARRMQLIDQLGLTVVSLCDAVAALKGGPPVPDNSVAITIDDGWYSTYRYMMPALLRHGFPATLYCDSAQLLRGGVVPHVMARYVRRLIGDRDLLDSAEQAYGRAIDVMAPYDERLAALEEFAERTSFDLSSYKTSRAFEYMSEEELREFSDAGFDIQLHTHNHTMGDLSGVFVRQELNANAAALAEIVGRPGASFKHFCYPSGVSSPEVADMLRGEGLESATTTVRNIARSNMHTCLLPRVIDGDNQSEIEFEAEMTGVASMLRCSF